jgi:hypothetical protein
VHERQLARASIPGVGRLTLRSCTSRRRREAGRRSRIRLVLRRGQQGSLRKGGGGAVREPPSSSAVYQGVEWGQRSSRRR